MSGRRPRILIHALDADLLGDGIASVLTPDKLMCLSRRAVALAEPGDLVVTDAPPDPSWMNLLARVGIESVEVLSPRGPGNTIIERLLQDREALDRIKQTQGVVEPYMGTRAVTDLATVLGLEIRAPSPRLVEHLNTKSSLDQILEQSALPRVPTRVAHKDRLRPCVNDALKSWSSVIVRSDLSIGGHGVWAIQSEQDIDPLIQAAHAAPDDRAFLIQPMLDVVSSPNVQWDLNPGNPPSLVGITDQHITPNLAFVGNTFPSRSPKQDQILNQSLALASSLSQMGYKGIVGIDLIVTSSQEVFIIEINPRVNTSTYAIALANRAGADAFVLATGIVARDNPLTDESVQYNKRTKEGMIPLTLPEHDSMKFDALFLAPTIERASKRRTSVEAQPRASVNHA